MANYCIEAEIINLSKKIKTLKAKDVNTKRHVRDRQKKWENYWSFSILLAEVIYQSENLKYLSLEDLYDLHDKYERQYNVKVDLNNILDKQWIRTIDSKICLPNAIKSSLSYFKDHRKDKQKPDFIIKHIEIFEFLNALQEKIGYEEEKNLIIKKSRLLKIIENHKSVFKRCPSYDFFKRINLLNELSNNEVELYLLHCNTSLDIDRKIASSLWVKLMTDKKLGVELTFDIWQQKILKIAFHLPNIFEFLQHRHFKKLIELAIKKIISEKDLDNSIKEIDKLFWDDYMLRDFHNRILTVPQKHQIDTSSPINLFHSLQRIEKSYHIVHYQQIRTGYLFLINLIIENDTVSRGLEDSFLSTRNMLISSMEKPYVFWKTIQVIKEKRPEILPYLLGHNQLSVVGQVLLIELKINPEIFGSENNKDIAIETEEVISEIWLQGFKIFIESRKFEFKRDETPYNIYVIFKSLLDNIYNSKHNKYNYYQEGIIIENLFEIRYNDSFNIFITQIRQDGNNNFLVSLVDTIKDAIHKKNSTPQDYKFVNLDLQKYDLLIRLLTFSKEATIKTNNQKIIIELVLGSLKSKFSLDEIVIQGDYELETERVNSKWIYEPFGLDKIAWDIFIIECYQQDRLDTFLKIHKGIVVTDEYEWNNSQAHKLRTFLKILMISFQNIFNKKDIHKRKGVEVQEILNELEATITKIIIKHCKNDIKEKSIDIFSKFLETPTFRKDKSLFPSVANVLNFFSKKNIESIISSITKSERLLYFYYLLYNTLISERDRAFLQVEIQNFKIEDFLDNANWLPDVENMLIESINSEVFPTNTKTILKFYESIVKKKKLKDSQNILFQIKLLLAYRDNDEKSIHSLEIPSQQYRIQETNQKFYNYKSYYYALFRIREEEFEKALICLEDICKKEPDNFQFNLRRLYTKSMIAIDLSKVNYKESETIFQEISEELVQLDQRYDEVKENEPDKYFNFDFFNLIKLICFKNLKQYANFEYTFFNALNSVQRLQKEFIELAVESFTKNNNFIQASKLISDAETFHRLRNDEVPTFISKLKDKLYDKKHVSELQSYFESILALKPENLITAIPERVNPYTKNIGEFLLWETVFASNQFLIKIKSINKNISEDEFTDFLQIIINGQLKSFNLKLEEQNRSGSSATKKKVGLGSVDLAFSNGIKNITFEAVRFYKKQSVKYNFDNIIEHIEKTFNYSTTKNYFYNIVYYQNDDFMLHYDEFKNNKITSVNFPIGYELKSQVDITSRFGNDAIKVLKTIHNKELNFYHIFLDLNYYQ